MARTSALLILLIAAGCGGETARLASEWNAQLAEAQGAVERANAHREGAWADAIAATRDALIEEKIGPEPSRTESAAWNEWAKRSLDAGAADGFADELQARLQESPAADAWRPIREEAAAAIESLRDQREKMRAAGAAPAAPEWVAKAAAKYGVDW